MSTVGPLVVATSMLLLVSGLLKVRSGARAGVGTPPLAVLEIVVAAACGGLVATGNAAASVTSWLVGSGFLLVVVSSILFAKKLAGVRRRRELTEGRRLETYVKHMSQE